MNDVMNLRTQLLTVLPGLCKSSRARGKVPAMAGPSMIDLFGDGSGESTRPPMALPEVDTLPIAELLEGEMKALGFYLSGHPVERYSPLIGAMATHDVATTPDRPSFVVAGMVGNLKLKTIKNGKSAGQKMAKFTIEDATGSVAAMMWPDVFRAHAEIVANGLVVFLVASPGNREDAREVVASAAIPARRAGPRFTSRIAVEIGDDPDGWPDYDSLIEFGLAHPGPYPLAFTHAALPFGKPAWHDGRHLSVRMSAAMIDDAESRFGPENVYLIGARGCVSRSYLQTIETQ